jgi:transposase
MLYVGLDIHIKHVTICVLDENGKLVRRGQVRTIQELIGMLELLPDRFEVCYEASCGYGFYHDLLRPLAARVVVAHPGQLRLIFRSKHKNDRKDAEKLAKLLFLGEVPAVHVPNPHVRSWRELITCRRNLVEKRTVAKNGLRALLRSIGVTPPRRPGLWTNAGVRWLRQLTWPMGTQALRRDLLLEEIDGVNRQIGRVEAELDRFSRDQTAVFQLMSIPGVGVRTAEAVVSFLDDPHRFPNSKAVGRYFGLVPSQDQSGRTNRLGHITREGSATVRRFLTEAAWQAVRRSPTVRAYFERVQRNDPERKKIALVATAHYLARVMYALLRRGELWQEKADAA